MNDLLLKTRCIAGKAKDQVIWMFNPFTEIEPDRMFMDTDGVYLVLEVI